MVHAPAMILLTGPAGAAPGPLEQALHALGHAPLRHMQESIALIAIDASDCALDLALLAARLRAWQDLDLPLIVLAPPGAPAAWTDCAYQCGALDVLPSPLLASALQAKVDYYLAQRATSDAHRDSAAALRDTRAQLDATLAAAELATWHWNLQTDQVQADPLMARIFGVDAAEAHGGPIAAYLRAIHPDDLPHTMASIEAAIASAKPYDVGYRVRGTDGAWRHIIARGHLRMDAQGAAEVLRGIVIDVTSQRQTEQQLRASEERYRTLFDSIDVGVCVIDVLFDDHGIAYDYRFVETNPAFVQHTGLSDTIGRTMLELAPAHEAHWFDIYGKVASTGQPARFVDEARALGRWYDVYATRVGGSGSVRVAVFFTDTSERVNADAQLRRLADDLAAADRRKSEFLATLAHELRNPLAPIRSGLQVLRLGGGDAAAAERVHDIMERQLTHLVALVDDLLDVARITHGQIELKRSWIDLADVLASAVETSRPLIDAEQHHLTVDVPDLALPLLADPTRLRQVVSNLLNNAAKYTPRGGRLVLSAHPEGGQVRISVADNGIGIAAHALHDVFDMFTQVGRDRQRARGGLGIGLSLVRSLVTLHGGSVEAASGGAGQGSVFSVRLPLASSAAAPPAAPADAVPAAAAMRVLVVDDNHDAAATLGELLGLVGHSVMVANSGGQALVQAASFRPQVIFLDIGMPGMNGYQTARALRADPDQDGVLLVALTGWGGDDDREATRQAGFDHHLTKPVDLDAVSALLGRHTVTLAGLPV